MTERFLLRPDLRIQLAELPDGPSVVLQCPHGLIEEPVVLPQAFVPVLHQLMQGVSSHELHLALQPLELSVEDFRNFLSDHTLLMDAHYQQALHELRRAFTKSSSRELALAGAVYERSPDALRARIEEGLRRASGKLTAPQPGSGPVVLVSPHIDYHRGFSAYCEAYAAIRNFHPSLILLLGTSHQGGEYLFQFLKKDFAHPYGVHALHEAAFHTLSASLGPERALADEILHRSEHSLELQVPFTGVLYPDVSVVPILVGSFHKFLSQGRSPQGDAEYEAFASSMLTLLAQRAERMLIVASVDMAHVGTTFGDGFNVGDREKKSIEAQDHEYLHLLQAGQVEELWEHVSRDSDARRICGFPTLFTLLDIFSRRSSGGLQAANFHYEQACSAAGDCLVSFASMLLSEPSF